MSRMFGTDGVRGVANIEPMTPATVMSLGQAMVEVLSPLTSMAQPFVIVGRDTRRSGPMFEAALAAGLYSVGVHVLNVGVMPTPGVAYLTRTRQALAGIMISASHNPFEDNGIKIFSATGAKLDDALEDAIEARMRSLPADRRRTGQDIGISLASDESLQCYTDFLKSTFRASSCHACLPYRVRLRQWRSLKDCASFI